MKLTDDVFKSIQHFVSVTDPSDASKVANQIKTNEQYLLRLSAKEIPHYRNLILNFLEKKSELTHIEKSIFLFSLYFEYLYDDKINFWLKNIFQRLANNQKRNDFLTQIMAVCFRRNRQLPLVVFDLFNNQVQDLARHIHIPPNKNLSNQSNRILISISQIRNLSHSPTQLMIDLYIALKKQNFEPFILYLDCHYATKPLPFLNYLSLKGGPEFEFGPNNFHLPEVEISVPVYYYNKHLDDPQGLQTLGKVLSQLNPKFIIGVGGFNVLQEAIGKFIPTAIQSTTSMLIPAPQTRIVNVSRELNDSDVDILVRAEIDPKIYKKTAGIGCQNEKYFRSEKYPRSLLNLAEDKILLVIVGNRLSFELQQKECEFIKSALLLDERITFLVIGKGSSGVIEKLGLAQSDRIMCIDNLPFEELGQTISACDFFINLDRAGGGASAVLALGHGTLVFSYAGGDVAQMLPAKYVCEDYDGLLTLVSTNLEHNRAASKESAHLIYRSFPDFDRITEIIVDELLRVCK